MKIYNKEKFIIGDKLQLINDIPLFSVIELNISPLCSRTCDFCPRGHGWRDPGKPLTIENLKKITKELRELDFRGIVHVAGFSEPLMHKNHYELMEELSRGSWWTTINTNGDFLRNKKQVELYDKIQISMYDGPHQKEKFIEMLDGFNIELLERYAKKFTELSNRAGYLENESDSQKEHKNHACNYPMYDLFINNNGDVLTCCHNWDLSITMGNVFESSLWDVWNGEKLKEYRTVLMNNREISPCDKCNVTGTLIGKEHMKSWNKVYSN